MFLRSIRYMYREYFDLGSGLHFLALSDVFRSSLPPFNGSGGTLLSTAFEAASKGWVVGLASWTRWNSASGLKTEQVILPYHYPAFHKNMEFSSFNKVPYVIKISPAESKQAGALKKKKTSAWATFPEILTPEVRSGAWRFGFKKNYPVVWCAVSTWGPLPTEWSPSSSA